MGFQGERSGRNREFDAGGVRWGVLQGIAGADRW